MSKSKPPKSFVEVICDHGEKPKSLGYFHPAVVEVMSPACVTTKGIPKVHRGPGAR